jgi:hypothetical protein
VLSQRQAILFLISLEKWVKEPSWFLALVSLKKIEKAKAENFLKQQAKILN